MSLRQRVAKPTAKSKIGVPGLFWISLTALGAAALVLRATLLHDFPLTPDEGIHLMWLRLLAAGYQPYSEVYITYPPLYPLAIQTVWSMWPTEEAQRWFSVVYTMFGLVGVALVARQFAGPAAGIAAAGLAFFSPPLVEPSRAVLGEFPAVAWSVWAVWPAWLYLAADRPAPRRGLVILSGLCLAASLLTKLLSPFMGVLIPLILIGRWLPFDERPGLLKFNQRADRFALKKFSALLSRLKPFWIDLALWLAALVLPALLLFSLYEVGPLLQQVVEQRLQARAAYTAGESFWPPRAERGLMFFREDPALVILGLVGLGLAWVMRQKQAWIMTAWVGLALLMLAVHNPIRYKHFLILIPPFASLGGFVIAAWLARLRRLNPLQRAAPFRRRDLITIAGGLFLVGLAGWQVAAAATVWQAKADVPQPPPDEVEALAFIEAVTAPDDCLITDDMQLVYWSGRMTPPELAEVSSNRLKSGALTLAELIAVSDAYDCQLVAAVSNRIPKFLPAYMEWVKAHYLGRFHYGEDDLFFAKIDTEPNPGQPLRADFDRQILFHGYTLTAAPVEPGRRVPLTLVWQAQTDLAMDYAIFVQLRDEAGHILVSADHQPYQGLLPTSTWPAGAVIQEVTWLALPPAMPPGAYNIYVGLYDPETLERLPLIADKSGENSLILGPLAVQ